MNGLLLSFYGDDFTGSTDVMESLTMGGVPAVLFLELPDPSFVREAFPGIRAMGVPGVGRTMDPDTMRRELPGIFEGLASFGASAFHYKICSTFDSSPEVGSIGCAIDIAQETFRSPYVPLLVGAPALNRFCTFGNLFARVGDTTHRLDRHPTMSRHPITPMNESDLRVHLGRQTDKAIGLMDILMLRGTEAELDGRFGRVLAGGPDIVLFDILDEGDLHQAGRLIWDGPGKRPTLLVGSSGIEYGLTSYWRKKGIIPGNVSIPDPGPARQLVVLSGSCSPTTAAQIEWAIDRGFDHLPIDTPALVDPSRTGEVREACIREAKSRLSTGRSLIVHAAMGPDDPRIPGTRGSMSAAGLNPLDSGRIIGEQLGVMLREILEATGLGRAVVTGGDTSGHATRQLGVYALELAAPIAPGAPLCLCRSRNPRYDGLQLSLKGGQNGKADYFGGVLAGKAL